MQNYVFGLQMSEMTLSEEKNICWRQKQVYVHRAVVENTTKWSSYFGCHGKREIVLKK